MVAKKAPASPARSNAHSGRDRVAEAGFTVAGERFKAYPNDYVIVDGSGPNDLSASALLVLYPDDSADHRRARGIILGARDRLRVAKPPPCEFVESCRNGLTQDVGVADLRKDKNGKTHVVILVGRQRIMSRRILDIEGAAMKPPEPPMAVICTFSAFIGKDFDAELAALEANCMSNCFVAEPPSVKASRAAALTLKGKEPGYIALRIGANGAEHVDLLLGLAACHESVWDAVDANKVALAQARILRTLAPEEQKRRMDRVMAGPSKAAKEAAGPTRPKAKARPVVESVIAELRRTGHHAEAHLLAWALGGPVPILGAHRDAIDSAESVRKAAKS